MNAYVKETLKTLAEIGGVLTLGFSGTVASIFRMVLCSSIKVAVKSKQYQKLRQHDECTILANGPSLKVAMENNEVRLNDVDIFCVNSFCESEYFWKLKPTSYFIIDGQFFNPTIERCQKQVDNLIDVLNMVDWKINLAIPAHAINGGVLKGLNNPNVTVIRFNTSTVDGYDWFCNLFYGIRMGMPLCINVVNFVIMSAIVMKYRIIYLYGIDHTFSAQLFVDDENCVCTSERHVYSTEPKVFRLPDSTMSQILGNMSNAFRIHEKLEAYSRVIGIKIYNCTKGSFVDAYERLYDKL